MRIISTIEARMNSSRLPGKVLLKAGGIPLLLHLTNRLKKVKIIDDLIIATTKKIEDDVIVDFARSNNIKFFRGSENDVMSRVIGAAESLNADVVVEVTGDCPIIDTSIVEQIIKTYLNNNVDYVSNVHKRSYPDGMDVQVYSLKTLKKSSSMTKKKLHREHVTLHIRENTKLFSRINCISPEYLYWPDLGLTLDEYSDYILLKKIIENFIKKKNPNFSCYEEIKFLKKNKQLLKINHKVQRKGDN